MNINDDSVFEPEEEFQVHLGAPQGDHWGGAMIGVNDVVTVIITNDEDGELLGVLLSVSKGVNLVVTIL